MCLLDANVLLWLGKCWHFSSFTWYLIITQLFHPSLTNTLEQVYFVFVEFEFYNIRSLFHNDNGVFIITVTSIFFISVVCKFKVGYIKSTKSDCFIKNLIADIRFGKMIKLAKSMYYNIFTTFIPTLFWRQREYHHLGFIQQGMILLAFI